MYLYPYLRFLYYYSRFISIVPLPTYYVRDVFPEAVQFMSFSRWNKKVKKKCVQSINYFTQIIISSTCEDDCDETRTYIIIIALTRKPNMQQTDNNEVQTGVFSFVHDPPSLLHVIKQHK